MPAPANLRAFRKKPLSGSTCRKLSPKLAKTKDFVIVISRFNLPVSQALLSGAKEALRREGVSARQIRVIWVPGAFELPVVAAQVANASPKPSAVIALGAVIRGETEQYKAIAQAVANGLSQLAVQVMMPVTYGVIVADSVAQAKVRAGGRMGNRGRDAALAAVATVRLLDSIKEPVES